MKKTLQPSSPALTPSSSAQHATTTDKRLADLQGFFEQLLKDWKAAGFAVAVVEKGQVIYAQGFGYRDYEQKLPVTPQTLFANGSLTKAFTAALVGLLQQEGKVDLDKPVRHYLPALLFYNDALNDTVTLRHLMSHQTGLPPHDFSWYLFTAASRDELVQRVQFLPPNAGVRERWQYNSLLYTVLGAVVEKLTGNSWEENMRQKIFQPLGMTHSNLSVKDLPDSDDASLGYTVQEDGTIRKMEYYTIDAMGPAGGINSSVRDMSHWLTTWLSGGMFKGKEILPGAFVTEALSPQVLTSATGPAPGKPDIHFAAYGFGWELTSYRGHYRAHHIGDIDGFKAAAALFPTDDLGIIVLCNQQASPLPDIVLNILADRLLGLEPYDWNGDQWKASETERAAQKEAVATKKAPAVPTHPSHPLADYTGRYTHPGYDTLAIYMKEDALVARAGEQQLWLRHNNYDVFDAFPHDPAAGTDTSGNIPILPIQFHLSVSGEVESLSVPFEPALPPIGFRKVSGEGSET